MNIQDDAVVSVINNLSLLIRSALIGAASRQYFPSHNANDDDDRIKEGKKTAAQLRKLREEFEDIATGILK